MSRSSTQTARFESLMCLLTSSVKRVDPVALTQGPKIGLNGYPTQSLQQTTDSLVGMVEDILGLYAFLTNESVAQKEVSWAPSDWKGDMDELQGLLREVGRSLKAEVKDHLAGQGRRNGGTNLSRLQRRVDRRSSEVGANRGTYRSIGGNWDDASRSLVKGIEHLTRDLWPGARSRLDDD